MLAIEDAISQALAHTCSASIAIHEKAGGQRPTKGARGQRKRTEGSES